MQLVWLLGDSDHPGQIDYDDRPLSLAARPRLLPLRPMAVWMVFVAAAITGLTWFAPLFAPLPADDLFGPLRWFFVAAVWLVVLPAMFAIFYGVNYYFEQKGDYFAVDKLRVTLRVGSACREFAKADIVAFTELSRWYWHAGNGRWVRQIGVLVRQDGGAITHYPLLRENHATEVADRLARIFQVPVIPVELSYVESRELGDC